MKDLLRRRGFRRLLIGQTISAFGDWIGTIGLMVLVLQVTNSSTAVGGVLVLRLLPATIAGPLAVKPRPVHIDHSVIVPAMTMLRGAILTICAPTRT